MKVLSKIKMLFAATAIASVMMPTAAIADNGETPGIGSMVIMSGLKNPWDMAFTKDGSMFFTEKCDGLSVKTASGVTKLYGMKGSKGYGATGNDLFCEGQAGMLGVTLDPKFASNRTLYLYSTSNKYHGDGCKTNFEKCDGNIVMKFKVAKDLSKVSGLSLIHI